MAHRGWLCGAAAALVLLAGAPAPSASASAPAPRDNPVVVWDINAQTAIWDIAAQQPNAQVRSFAMVSGAVYDAVNAIAGVPYQPYLVAPRTTGTESTEAAVATAAYRVMADLFPAQSERLRAQYDEYLAEIPDGRSKRAGIAVGGRAAAAMVDARRDDGAFGSQQWTVGDQPGQWRPTPPAFVSDGAWLGFVRPFLLPSAEAFTAPGPPALTSRTYARDLDEVKLVGAAGSTVRTADQTEAAIWWHDRRSVGWEIKRQLAVGQRLDPLRTARLFAMVDLVVADTGIACFRQKEAWGFWRPITAIRAGDDPGWTPLLVTPPFPEYPSGHACATGARMSVFRSFFARDTVQFHAYSVDADATRSFTRFSQAVEELVGARVWGGLHFRTADVDGVRLGEAVARYGIGHHFRPRPSHGR
ncbi:vanadium-dependent haloperoxidase [Phytohabitans flavus]|uniref:Uncharacterized protein n=1 Tax=Phytohabitans flavus TaxID=1076124 RepID=A0A6F8XWG4_9ACTN|nr:vanadium-dependent haloperoxidase [Phytohabitans flavus]BCB78081.1 hypothetical protein Pflav_044910 [Phytohabitans flavus]